jgi:hypothetical protein
MGLKESHHAIPHNIVRAKLEERRMKKEGKQKLDGIVRKASQLVEFSREGVLKAVAEFIVCDNQVSDVDYVCDRTDQILQHLAEPTRGEQGNVQKLSGCHASKINNCGPPLNS